MKKKRGQFFLIAAIVIVAVTVSSLTISNYGKTSYTQTDYSQTGQATSIKTIGEEMEIESNFVLDYGASQGKTKEEMYTLMQNFTDNYVRNLESARNIYFIFGEEEKLHFKGYQGLTKECACIVLNNPSLTGKCEELIDAGNCIRAQISDEQNKITQNLTLGGNSITEIDLHLENNSYHYTINPGQNFYFVIWGNEQGGKKIAVKR